MLITTDSVTNCAIGNIPKDAQLVVSHEKLAARALEDSPQAEHIWVKDFTQNNVYDIVSERLKGVDKADAPVADAERVKEGILLKENVVVGMKPVGKIDAIRAAGEMLVSSGYVEKPYVDGMIARELDISTYIGKGIAIPHGENAVKQYVKKSGIVILQFPEGVDFGNGNKAHIIVGIAGKDNDHLAILANIASAMDECSDDELQKLYTTADANVLYDMFTKSE